jgi:hypothetical protein
MEELHVQRKRGSPLRFWLLLVVFIIRVAVYIFMHFNPKNVQINTTRPIDVLTFKKINQGLKQHTIIAVFRRSIKADSKWPLENPISENGGQLLCKAASLEISKNYYL